MCENSDPVGKKCLWCTRVKCECPNGCQCACRHCLCRAKRKDEIGVKVHISEA